MFSQVSNGFDFSLHIRVNQREVQTLVPPSSFVVLWGGRQPAKEVLQGASSS